MNLQPNKILYLAPNSKQPDTQRHPRGYLDAVELDGYFSYEDVTGIPEENYGIVLNDQYVVIDIDDAAKAPKSLLTVLDNSGDWRQKTGKGYHYLFTVPPDSSLKTQKLVNEEGEVYGDFKANGYIVGPGSTINGHTYEYLGGSVLPFPRHLLPYLKKNDKEEKLNREGFNGVQNGSHDDFLTSLGGLGVKYGLSESALFDMLKAGRSMLSNQNPDDEYTDKDLAKKAKAYFNQWEADVLHSADRDDCIVKGCSFLLPLFSWYIHGFIPMGGYLVTAYAPGGTGKSSFGHYLAGLITKRQHNFLVINHEDPPEYWKACAVVSDADPEYLYSHSKPLQIKLPASIEYLEELIKEHSLQCIWFDSIKDHFSPDKGSDAATNARNALSPLAELAQRTGCLIIGIFHTNKKGLPGGSTEMLNVARHVLEFSRKPNGPLMVRVEKSNLFRPPYMLSMVGSTQELRHPNDTSRTILEETESGERVVRQTYITQGYTKDSDTLKEAEEAQEREATKTKIELLVEEGMTQRQIAAKLGLSQSYISKLLKPSHTLSSI